MRETLAENEETGREEPVKMMEKEYRPSDLEVLKEHEISIRFLSGRGCMIRVGCREIAFENNERAMNALMDYIRNPYEESEKWREIFNQ